MRTVIIGLGNPLRADDGVGLSVARLLGERLRGGGVDVAELWAGGLRLVEAMTGYDRAVVVDAMSTRAVPPGSIRKLRLSDLGGSRNIACVHDTSLPTALEMWRRAGEPLPAEISIWGIEVQDMDSFSEDLTGPVAEAVPRAANAILDELRTWGGA